CARTGDYGSRDWFAYW
nr:immunoglobulin heavy chain junction region [Mus musculus]